LAAEDLGGGLGLPWGKSDRKRSIWRAEKPAWGVSMTMLR